MTNDARSRKPADHGEAVGFCLQIAATNSALLSCYADSKSGLHADLNPLAHGIRITVVDALKAAARHVDVFAENTARDIGQRLTAEQESAKAEAIRALGRELVALSDRAVSQTIAFAEFEDIRVRLMDQGLILGPYHALDVAAAIMDPGL
ncbi:hypothetical protein D3273_26810 [Lichenibacterium minor]|uniref:Uncharacterized protein n=1 Tax=Lichenibacterium minor TaxID=2316528 RepID=A0A4Q2U238_9HYPH|nr:hypothetical protein [Lichenibacterium minor]RYC28901.1 hypothetical protein D3273_26810 [Lichenibacterium minor]